MDGEHIENELSKWFSTYGLITAERILGKYNLKLSQAELLQAINKPNSFYHGLLQVPLKNVLNGIILQQANDYHVYAQKLFIDYLISGESGKPPESPGASSRETMEEERKKLVAIGDEFHQLELNHNQLIALSQSSLIKLTKEWRDSLQVASKQLSTIAVNMNDDAITDAINSVFIQFDLKDLTIGNSESFIVQLLMKLSLQENQTQKEKIEQLIQPLMTKTLAVKDILNEFITRVSQLNDDAKEYRTKFYDSILRTIEIIRYMPEYKIDPEQDQINRESLHFDKSIGEL
jgi:hypothetical protein